MQTNGKKPVTLDSEALALPSRWSDLMVLIKMRLTVLVVLSALLAYLIAADGEISSVGMIVLGLGGFFITAAANALNQVLEKDYDLMMTRTANRPVARGRLAVSDAVMYAGIFFVVGILLLAYFNLLAAVLGACAVVSYAFLYTPMKRFSSMSVFVGAVPGALPTMIAVVAADNAVTHLALVLFGIQFFWQFAHFWSIGFLGFEDYKKAGFKLVPELNGKVHPNLGFQSMIFCLLLLPFAIAPFFLGMIGMWASILISVLGMIYAFYGWNLQKEKSDKAAKKLMFYSFAYLPITLLIFYLGSL